MVSGKVPGPLQACHRPSRRAVGGSICSYCDDPITDVSVAALVPDSTVVNDVDSSLDGRRYVIVCCEDHLRLLIAQAREQWVSEQLWLGQLCRASRSPGARTNSLAQLAHLAGLNTEALHATLCWNARRPEPLPSLPSGHSLTPGSAPLTRTDKPISEVYSPIAKVLGSRQH